MAKDKPVYASMSPDDAEQGGIFQGGRATVVKARYQFGYRDGQNPNIITLGLTLKSKAMGEETFVEFLSCGAKAMSVWKPTKDGRHLEQLHKDVGKGLSAQCNAMIFYNSLKDAGVPNKLLQAGDMSVLDGAIIEFRRKPMKREGLNLTGEDGAAREQTVLVAEKVIKFPGLDGAPVPLKKAAPAPVEEPVEDEEEDEEDEAEEAEPETDDDEDEAEEADDEAEEADADAEVDDKFVAKHLRAVIESVGGSIKKSKLGTTAFKQLAKLGAARNAICSRMVEDDFLKTAKGVAFDPKTGVIGLK